MTNSVLAGLASFAIAIGCGGQAGNGARPPETAPPAPVTGDLLPQAVVITFRQDSLHLRPGVSPDSVSATLQRVVAALQQSNQFEVLAISPAVYAVKVRPLGGGDPKTLAASLSRHPGIARAEVEQVAGRP